MKFCQMHWDRLRDAIREREIYHLVATDGEDVVARMKEASESDKPTLAMFDPLNYAHMQIISHALDAGGLAIMAHNDDGSERCPICFMSEQHDLFCTRPGCDVPKDGTAFDAWIGYAADDAKRMADRLESEA